MDAKILWANEAALVIGDRAEDFILSSGFFTCKNTLQDQAFRAFLTRLEEQADTWICRTRSGDNLIIRGDPIRPNNYAPAAALTIYSSDPSRRYLWSDFAPVFNLTRAEAQIARRMVEGSGAQDIADELAVSIETVRTHIRRLYAKMGITSRERLFALINPFRV